MVGPRLDIAAGMAVTKSRSAFAEMRAKADDLVLRMHEIAGRRSWPGAETASARFMGAVQERSREINRIFADQAGIAETFNIVLLGRTGAGKSSLFEAMTEGTGRGVSPLGESDWTKEVDPRLWHCCKVYDTPGVNGWGREDAPADLEARARYAVETADFVLLCFDTQSQQASEFTKIAQWVGQFNKPVIAVLNVRNAVWRLPHRVPAGVGRAKNSEMVAQHATNIRDELTAIGLDGVPVVAVSSKRALFARATLPFNGPDAETFEAHRTIYSIQKLDAWSNLPTLEGLLVRCIEDHAVALRLGALHDQLRAVLEDLAASMDADMERAGTDAAIIETQTLEPLLKLLGYPLTAVHRRPYCQDGVDRLAALEQLRGRFQSPSSGEFERFVRQRLTAELGVLRSKSLIDAEETVTYAFDRGSAITSEEVRHRCFRPSEMEEAARTVIDEANDFVGSRTRLAYRDSVADLRARLHAIDDIRGDAGSRWKYAAWGIKTTNVLAGAAGALGTFALANAWNPLGWTAATAALVAGLATGASILFGWFGGKARRNAEAEKLGARRSALAEVRRHVHLSYDDFAAKVADAAMGIVADAAAQAVLPAVDQALDLRQLADACGGVARNARHMLGTLPLRADSQRLVWQAKEACEAEVFPGQAGVGPRLWLGESWITDPDGLKSDHFADRPRRTVGCDTGVIDSLLSGARETWAQVTSRVEFGSGRAWLAAAVVALHGDDLARPVLDELHQIAVEGRPRLHLVGDYNAGKSSFIKRLLLDSGAAIPADLHVRADPTTDRERRYSWGQVDLVDTPGFQSSNACHSAAALRSFPDATAVLYLFQPNLILGDDRALRAVLLGDVRQGLIPKAPRTFFIINRTDELGVDPFDNPARYKILAERKQRELSEALATRGVSVLPARILCMASDPYGLVGDREDATAEAYDGSRCWDGFHHFNKMFKEIEGELVRTGLDRTLLDGGIARLAMLDAQRAAEREARIAQSEAVFRMEALVTEHKAEGGRLIAEHRARLVLRIEEHVAALTDEVLSEQDPVRLKLKAEALARWHKDPALRLELEHWAKEASKELEAWRLRCTEAIDRRLESAEFGAAFPDPVISMNREAISDARGPSWFRQGFDKVGRLAGTATRDVVYGIGKKFGVKFKPWGATNLARRLGKAGGVVAAIGVVWDAADIVLDERRHAHRERLRREIASRLGDEATKFADALAEGDDAEPGMLREVTAFLAVLDGYLAEVKTEQAGVLSVLAGLDARRAAYALLRTSAEAALGGDVWEQA